MNTKIKALLTMHPEFKFDVFEFIYGGEDLASVHTWLANRIAEKLSREFLDANL